jgi:hypothetical protein
MKILLIFLFLINLASAKVIVKEGFWISDLRIKTLKLLKSRPELTIDHWTPSGFEIYGPKGLEVFLKQNKIRYSFLKEDITSSEEKNGYMSPEEVEAELKFLAKSYPQLSKLYSIGKSVEKRDLWVMKLSNNAAIDDDRPEFKYIANMHGNEIVGREIMLRFIQDCLKSYNNDKNIKNIMDKFQIHILVSMNPDGAKSVKRGNANDVDLNRDFPDFASKDNVDSPANRAPETQAVMNWQAKHHFKLSANFHGGAEVVNYPWDTIETASPQEHLVKDLSLLYAQNSPYILASTVFTNGITNGFAWYEVKGGMQDWSIYWRHDLQLTIELSNIKWPNYNSIDYYYQQNRDALIRLIERTDSI